MRWIQQGSECRCQWYDTLMFLNDYHRFLYIVVILLTFVCRLTRYDCSNLGLSVNNKFYHASLFISLARTIGFRFRYWTMPKMVCLLSPSRTMKSLLHPSMVLSERTIFEKVHWHPIPCLFQLYPVDNQVTGTVFWSVLSTVLFDYSTKNLASFSASTFMCILLSTTESLWYWWFRYTGHQNTKYKIESCLDRNDSVVISGSEDGVIYVWDMVEESIIAQLKQHTRAVQTLSYHPTQPMLLSGSSDGTIVVWK